MRVMSYECPNSLHTMYAVRLTFLTEFTCTHASTSEVSYSYRYILDDFYTGFTDVMALLRIHLFIIYMHYMYTVIHNTL